MALVVITQGDRTIVVCKPKPPKIGSNYVQPKPYRRPYTNMHSPDQDRLQAALLGVKYHSGTLGALLDIWSES